MRFLKVVLASIIYLLITQQVWSQSISREEIQNFFVNTRGNSAYQPMWFSKFQGKHVSWSGTIFLIQYQSAFNRTEFSIKAMPSTLLYDTIVYVPGNMTEKFKIKDNAAFSGVISKGIDMLGVKEVHVNVEKNMSDYFGNFVFADNGTVEVNFLKESSTKDPAPQ